MSSTVDYFGIVYGRNQTMNWKYYELVEGVHNKFWMIARHEDGKGFTARWGKIGTTGQMQMKNFSSVSRTIKAFNDKVWEKTKKRYVLKHHGDDFLTAEGANAYRPGRPITETMKYFRRRDPIVHDPNKTITPAPKKKKAKGKKTAIKPKFKIRIRKRKAE